MGGGVSKTETTPSNSTTKEVVTEAPAPAPTTAETSSAVVEDEDFTLLDVSSDLIDAAIYSIDETGTEYVITLFRDPSGNNYISLFSVDANGNGDVVCGPYDETNISTLQTDDGSVAVTNVDFSVIMEGEYLSADQAIDYMAAAISFLE